MKIKYALNIVVIVIIILGCVYISSVILFHESKPIDIYTLYLGKSTTYQEPILIKKFHKYAFVGSFFFEWRNDNKLSHLKWDSTWNYTLRINGYNNLTHPIFMDSILIIDVIKKTPTLIIRCSHVFLKSNSAYFFDVDLNSRFVDFVKDGLHYDNFFPHEGMNIDTLNDIRFNSNSLYAKIFTSADQKELRIIHRKVIKN